jgi:cobalamin biosynthesis Mg chelatase CobN
MARRTTIAVAAACGLALTLLPASTALAGAAFDEVLKDYQKDGKLDACSHSEKTLQDAQSQIPNDIEQYAPDLPAAIKAALRERAAGACDKGGTSTTSTTATAAGGASASGGGSSSSGGGTTSTPTPTSSKPGAPPAPPPLAKPAGGELANSVSQSATASTAGTPVPIILLAILGAIILAIALFALLARFMGWEFRRLQPVWHSWREAGWRTENTWSEFLDWVRLGR